MNKLENDNGREAANEQCVKLLGELNEEHFYQVFNYAKKLKGQEEFAAIQSNNNGSQMDDQYYYLNILSSEARELVIRVIKENNFNLYHSAAAYINNRIQLTPDQIFDSYYKKYANKRDYVNENKELIREIITKVQIKLVNKNYRR